MNDKRVPWANGRRALVLTSRGWRECEGMASGRREAWVWTCPSTNFMGEPSTTEVWEEAQDGEDLQTRPLPDHCGTCFLPFGCGCPGDGWSVPVHVKLPAVMEGVTLREVGDPDDARVPDGKEWRRFGAYYSPGERTAPMVPFRNGAPIYVKLWGKM